MGAMAEFTRFLRTVAHLEARQIAHRGRAIARRAIWARAGARIDARYRARAAALAPARFDHPGLARVAGLRAERVDPGASLRTAQVALAGRFSFLDRSRDLGEEVDWYRADLDSGTRPWKTLLHEFPFAVDLALAGRASAEPGYRDRLLALVRSWCAASPVARPDSDRDAWNARAVATRLVSWALAASLFGLRREEPGGEMLSRELAVHALFLRDHLEWDTRANHLLRDVVGLVFAHELFGCDADALSLLRDQVAEQVLVDGCHVERVPLYHAVVLQDLVEVRALLGDGAPDWLDDAVARMAGFLAYLLPGDGRLPLLGDTWHGVVEPQRLLAEAGESIPPSSGAPEHASGLVVLRRGDAHAVLRAGAHGPDYQLGHAHADGLSFELSRGERRVVTDTGTLTYDTGPARERLRSTAAHNTVQIDGAEQIECWSSFRVGRRGRARVTARGSDARWDWVVAQHDGYRWLPGRPQHRRLLAVSDEAAIVLDAITGGGRHTVRSALHLHPELGPDDRRALALGAEAQCAVVPLHERFNTSRDMEELFVETRAPLPWYGGWLVLFSGGQAPCASELRDENGVVHASCRSARFEVEIRWALDPVDGGSAVRISSPRGAGSAT